MNSESNQSKNSSSSFFSGNLLEPFKRAWLALIAFIKKLSIFPSGEPEQDDVPPEPPVTDVQWKKDALEDFKQWLSEISSDDPPTKSITPDTCDLYTMLSEFVTLRQEIKMQNREHHRTIAALNKVKNITDDYEPFFKLFKERTSQLPQLEQNIRLNCEKKSASHFFDVRDSLVRGHRASVEIAAKRGFFTRPPKGIETICEGYEMAINRFDKALSMMDIEPVETHHVPFNPETMKAVETREAAGVENAMVLETVSCGFVREKEVFRHAKVVVSYAPEASPLDTSDAPSEATLDTSPSDTSDAPSEDTTEASPSDASDAPSEATPDASPSDSSDTPSEATPDASPSDASDAPSEATPDTSPSDTSDAPSEATPDAPPSDVSDAPSEDTPDALSSDSPDAPSKDSIDVSFDSK